MIDLRAFFARFFALAHIFTCCLLPAFCPGMVASGEGGETSQQTEEEVLKRTESLLKQLHCLRALVADGASSILDGASEDDIEETDLDAGAAPGEREIVPIGTTGSTTHGKKRKNRKNKKKQRGHSDQLSTEPSSIQAGRSTCQIADVEEIKQYELEQWLKQATSAISEKVNSYEHHLRLAQTHTELGALSLAHELFVRLQTVEALYAKVKKYAHLVCIELSDETQSISLPFVGYRYPQDPELAIRKDEALIDDSSASASEQIVATLNKLVRLLFENTKGSYLEKTKLQAKQVFLSPGKNDGNFAIMPLTPEARALAIVDPIVDETYGVSPEQLAFFNQATAEEPSCDIRFVARTQQLNLITTALCNELRTLIKLTDRCMDHPPKTIEELVQLRTIEHTEDSGISNQQLCNVTRLTPYGNKLFATATTMCQGELCKTIETSSGGDIGSVGKIVQMLTNDAAFKRGLNQFCEIRKHVPVTWYEAFYDKAYRIWHKLSETKLDIRRQPNIFLGTEKLTEKIVPATSRPTLLDAAEKSSKQKAKRAQLLKELISSAATKKKAQQSFADAGDDTEEGGEEEEEWTYHEKHPECPMPRIKQCAMPSSGPFTLACRTRAKKHPTNSGPAVTYNKRFCPWFSLALGEDTENAKHQLEELYVVDDDNICRHAYSPLVDAYLLRDGREETFTPEHEKQYSCRAMRGEIICNDDESHPEHAIFSISRAREQSTSDRLFHCVHRECKTLTETDTDELRAWPDTIWQKLIALPNQIPDIDRSTVHGDRRSHADELAYQLSSNSHISENEFVIRIDDLCLKRRYILYKEPKKQ